MVLVVAATCIHDSGDGGTMMVQGLVLTRARGGDGGNVFGSISKYQILRI
jgi:hypothetical protein